MAFPTPVFIGGAGRSGTTLVADMLGLHPRISPIYETDFILDLARILFSQGRKANFNQMKAATQRYMDAWTRPLPQRPHNKRSHEKYFHGPHHILFDRKFALQETERLLEGLARGEQLAAFQRFVYSLFEEHCRIDGKPRWVNKTPVYVKNLSALDTLFPGMIFIHCIRDGRDTACSVITRPWGPATFREAAGWWVDQVSSGLDFGRIHPERYVEVKFEDLLTDTASTLKNLLIFLGEDSGWQEIVRKYENGSGDNGLTLSHAPLDRWRTEFSPEDQRTFKDIAGRHLESFGYPSS